MHFSHFVLLFIIIKSNMSNEQDFLNQDEYAKELKQYFLDLKSSSKSVMIVTTTSSSSLSSLEAISTTQLTTTQITTTQITTTQLITTQLTTTHHLTKKITHLSQDEYAKELSFLKKNKWSQELTTASSSPKSSVINNKATSYSKVKYFFIY